MISEHKLALQLELWPFHLDLRKRYPLSQLVSRMIHVAGEHATHFGYGIDHLMAHGASWVLSRMSIRFTHPIGVEPLTITTGVTGWSGISTDRIITLQQRGELVATAFTKWIAIDVEKRLPLPIDTILNDHAIKATFPDLDLPEIPRRLIERSITDSLQTVYCHKVRYSDLDINRHVNSSVWIALAMDALPLEHIVDEEMAEAHIRFVKEARLGDELTVKHYAEGAFDYVQIDQAEAVCFQLMIKRVSKYGTEEE